MQGDKTRLPKHSAELSKLRLAMGLGCWRTLNNNASIGPFRTKQQDLSRLIPTDTMARVPSRNILVRWSPLQARRESAQDDGKRFTLASEVRWRPLTRKDFEDRGASADCPSRSLFWNRGVRKLAQNDLSQAESTNVQIYSVQYFCTYVCIWARCEIAEKALWLSCVAKLFAKSVSGSCFQPARGRSHVLLIVTWSSCWGNIVILRPFRGRNYDPCNKSKRVLLRRMSWLCTAISTKYFLRSTSNHLPLFWPESFGPPKKFPWRTWQSPHQLKQFSSSSSWSTPRITW